MFTRVWVCRYVLIMPCFRARDGIASEIQVARTIHAEIDRVVPGANDEDPLPRAMWDAEALGGLPLYVRVAENAPIRVRLDPRSGSQIKAEIAASREKYRNDDAADAIARAEWKPGSRVQCRELAPVVEITHVVNEPIVDEPFSLPCNEGTRPEITYYGRRVLKDGTLSHKVMRCVPFKGLPEGLDKIDAPNPSPADAA